MQESNQYSTRTDEAAAVIQPGHAVVIHRKPLTVIVAVENSVRGDSARAMSALVDKLIDDEQFEFGPVAGALQDFVVERQPAGVAALLDIAPEPILFLFDDATAIAGGETHSGVGRSGWTTAFATANSRVELAAGQNPDGDDSADHGWTQLREGTVGGGSVVVTAQAPGISSTGDTAASTATRGELEEEAETVAERQRTPVATHEPIAGANLDDIPGLGADPEPSMVPLAGAGADRAAPASDSQTLGEQYRSDTTEGAAGVTKPLGAPHPLGPNQPPPPTGPAADQAPQIPSGPEGYSAPPPPRPDPSGPFSASRPAEFGAPAPLPDPPPDLRQGPGSVPPGPRPDWAPSPGSQFERPEATDQYNVPAPPPASSPPPPDFDPPPGPGTTPPPGPRFTPPPGPGTTPPPPPNFDPPTGPRFTPPPGPPFTPPPGPDLDPAPGPGTTPPPGPGTTPPPGPDLDPPPGPGTTQPPIAGPDLDPPLGPDTSQPPMPGPDSIKPPMPSSLSTFGHEPDRADLGPPRDQESSPLGPTSDPGPLSRPSAPDLGPPTPQPPASADSAVLPEPPPGETRSKQPLTSRPATPPTDATSPTEPWGQTPETEPFEGPHDPPHSTDHETSSDETTPKGEA